MRILGYAAALVTAGAMVAGCGTTAAEQAAKDGGGTAAATAAPSVPVPAFAKDFAAPPTGCGSSSAKLPADPDGAIAQLPKSSQDALGGYADFPGSTVKVLKSRWSDWKPSGSGPYTIAVSWGQLVSDFQVQTLENLKKDLKAIKGVGKVEVRTTGNNLDIAQQLQQYNAIVQSKPDLIVMESPSPDSFNGPVQQAAKRGIPTITLLTPVAVDGAVNVDSNNYLAATDTASYLTKVMGGKGRVLLVRALSIAAVDSQVATGFKRVFKSCPGIKVAGEVFGGFSEAGAKSEVLKWLGTHPGKLDGIGVLPGESAGTLQALKQSGGAVPPAAEVGLDKGFLGYWAQNDAAYDAASTSLMPVPAARATAEVAGRMLEGQGVKLNTLVGKTPLITDANLADRIDPSWSLRTPGTLSGEADDFLPSAALDSFFTATAGGA